MSLDKPKKIIQDYVKAHRCPICNVHSSYVYPIHESGVNETALWYQCNCGVVFQENKPLFKHTKEKITDYTDSKEYNLRSIHAARCYANMIEELTYGRIMLDVGCISDRVMTYFKNRGWITFGIDINEHVKYSPNIYIGDFETYNFNPKSQDSQILELIKKGKIKTQYDMIWMSHVLEHFIEPVSALKKAYNLLSEDGVMYIATPDMDFLTKTGMADFPHWKKHEHYVMWDENSLKREVEQLGFKVIMSRRNFSSRFMSWYDLHLICQKRFF